MNDDALDWLYSIPFQQSQYESFLPQIKVCTKLSHSVMKIFTELWDILWVWLNIFNEISKYFPKSTKITLSNIVISNKTWVYNFDSVRKNDNYFKLNMEGCLDSLHIFLMRRIPYAGGGSLTGRYYQAVIP